MRKTRIQDLKPYDVVSAHGGLFRITAAPYDSITHGPKDPATGYSMGPAGVAVARAVCIAGHVPGYFHPDSDWAFQGTGAVTVHVL
jgi:hypothetical protein